MSIRYTRNIGKEGKRGSKKDPKIVFSFEYLDVQQGQTFKEWSKKDYLLKLIEIGKTLNKHTVNQALADQLIIQYDIKDKKKWGKNNMPKVSKWKYPKLLPKDDVPWSKIELGRKLRVIGYLELNIFYVVFLDKEHDFFPSIS